MSVHQPIVGDAGLFCRNISNNKIYFELKIRCDIQQLKPCEIKAGLSQSHAEMKTSTGMSKERTDDATNDAVVYTRMETRVHFIALQSGRTGLGHVTGHIQ